MAEGVASRVGVGVGVEAECESCAKGCEASETCPRCGATLCAECLESGHHGRVFRCEACGEIAHLDECTTTEEFWKFPTCFRACLSCGHVQREEVRWG